MAIIDHLNLANTWNDWLNVTSELITFNNDFTDNANTGNGIFEIFTDADYHDPTLNINADLTVAGNLNLGTFGDFSEMVLPGNVIIEPSDTGGSGFFVKTANVSGTVASRWSIMGDSSVYAFDFSNEGNPNLYVEPGRTYAFDLQKLNGLHPFVIRTTNEGANVTDGSSFYNVGLTHVEVSSNNLIIRTGYDAQLRNKGILYWKVPANTLGTQLYYQCTAHPVMNGTIYIENTNDAAFPAANGIVDDATAFAIALGGSGAGGTL